MQGGVVVMNSHRGHVVHSTPVGTGPSPNTAAATCHSTLPCGQGNTHAAPVTARHLAQGARGTTRCVLQGESQLP